MNEQIYIMNLYLQIQIYIYRIYIYIYMNLYLQNMSEFISFNKLEIHFSKNMFKINVFSKQSFCVLKSRKQRYLIALKSYYYFYYYHLKKYKYNYCHGVNFNFIYQISDAQTTPKTANRHHAKCIINQINSYYIILILDPFAHDANMHVFLYINQKTVKSQREFDPLSHTT